MPRVLVADDNSNIHRSVALALKEAGVEVVAVGNGEAAVRKMAETKFDLVLADIFMPVRSGYEVCEFVKQDPRFSNVPVVLLIGAFDPFDEREAQRVKADAILKKPFVPPDSLLRTVSDLLAQSASKPSAAPATATTAKLEHAHSQEPPQTIKQAEPVEYIDQAPEELTPTKTRLEWNPSEQPIAFGTLLETPTPETDTDGSVDAVMTAQRDPNLGEPAFWAPQADEQTQGGEAQTEEVEAQSLTALDDKERWLPGIGVEELETQQQPVSEISAPQPVAEEPEHLTELPELPELITSGEKTVESPAAKSKPHLEMELTELPSLNLEPSESSLPLYALSPLSASPVIEMQKADITAGVDEPLPDLKDFEWASPSDLPDLPHSQPEPELTEQSESPSEDPTNPSAPMATLAPFLASLTSTASARKNAPPEEGSPFDTGSDLPGRCDQKNTRSESLLETTEPFDGPVAEQLDPAVVEAIAQRVIERMQPKIIELVTRELLRPAVEALVQRELEKK